MASQEATETKSIITGLLTSNPLRCTIKQLCDDFRNIIGYNIPIRKLGFGSVEEYLRSIPDTVHVFGFGPSAEVQGVIKERSAHINVMVAKQKRDSIPIHKRKNIKVFKEMKHQKIVNENTCNMVDDKYSAKVPKRIQNNLQKLIMGFPNGIWCTKLPLEYEKMYNEKLRYENYCYTSLIEMCTDLPEIFHYIQPKSDDFMLYDKNKAIPSLNQNEINWKQSNTTKTATEIDWSLGSLLLCSDAIQFLYEIPQYSFSNIKVGDYLDVKIGEVHDIKNFWMFPKYSKLDNLMNQLQLFFNERRNRYVIHELFLQEGLYCTVYHKNKYHRGVIIYLSSKQPTLVEVLLIDYGIVSKVHIDEIWYLPEQFGNIPCQAVKAQLSHICSINSDLAVKKFRELATNAELVAEVIRVNTKDLCLEIYLANISDEQNIFYLNDALVEKGYANYT